MPLQATSGAASYDGFGGGVAAVPNYIEDVFSTYLWTGDGASGQTINNGINLSGKGGLMWMKPRTSTSAYSAYWNRNQLYDTVRGIDQLLSSNTTDEQGTVGNLVTSVTSTGFTIGAAGPLDFASVNYASWTFRKAEKFFDVVTYTGNGTSGRTVAHNLGSTPGCIIVKRLDLATQWYVYHRSLGATKFLELAAITAETTGNYAWNDTAPTSTQFTVGNGSSVNTNGATYVAYLFAHDAGGFGLTGSDNVISCGSFTTDGSGNATVSLGYEPQLFLRKRTDDTGNWTIVDNMRGFTAGGTDAFLYPNLSNAEATSGGSERLTSTGVQITGFGASISFIYIAIRRGPMKVPTSGTSVFYPNATSAAAGTVVTTNFPVDLEIGNFLDNYDNKPFTDRLRGYATSTSSRTNAPFINSVNALGDVTTGAPFSYNWWNKSVIIGNYISEYRQVSYYFGRAPNFFDIVCYTGAGNGTVVSHNLGVEPELAIIKQRSASNDWIVRAPGTGADRYVLLNKTNAQANASGWYSATASQITFTTAYGVTAGSGDTYVGYLFATCAGVSKVGSYTGNGTTQTINCGFGAGGARFVLLRRTDTTGDWYVYDTSRGMTVVTDPYLRLNTNEPEVATLGSVTTVSTGFALNSAILAAINANGGTYIFLAIA